MIGDSDVFKFKSNRDGSLTIVDIQAGRDVVVLFPNDLRPSNRIDSEAECSIPSGDDGFKITVTKLKKTDWESMQINIDVVK